MGSSTRYGVRDLGFGVWGAPHDMGFGVWDLWCGELHTTTRKHSSRTAQTRWVTVRKEEEGRMNISLEYMFSVLTNHPRPCLFLSFFVPFSFCHFLS